MLPQSRDVIIMLPQSLFQFLAVLSFGLGTSQVVWHLEKELIIVALSAINLGTAACSCGYRQTAKRPMLSWYESNGTDILTTVLCTEPLHQNLVILKIVFR